MSEILQLLEADKGTSKALEEKQVSEQSRTNELVHLKVH